jgi:hypothetical protein
LENVLIAYELVGRAAITQLFSYLGLRDKSKYCLTAYIDRKGIATTQKRMKATITKELSKLDCAI